MSDKTDRLEHVSVRFARSATRHRVSKDSIRHVIAHCGRYFEQAPPPGRVDENDTRLLLFGDDERGLALEVVAVERFDGDLFVIHAMRLRGRYNKMYEEAKRWRR